jgi:hypothetical protein
MDLFPSSDGEWETPTLMGPLETANLFHISEILRSNCERETGYRIDVFFNFLQSPQASDRKTLKYIFTYF